MVIWIKGSVMNKSIIKKALELAIDLNKTGWSHHTATIQEAVSELEKPCEWNKTSSGWYANPHTKKHVSRIYRFCPHCGSEILVTSKKALNYPALITLDENGHDYNVIFPDLPGCITCGVNLRDAKRNAQEVLALYIDSMKARGKEIPLPTKQYGPGVFYF
jgi:predicted RNase H-like HicB family nuclease